jgi:3-phenylpropionate/trans-cinnamate dioxygenase ferredoxin component
VGEWVAVAAESELRDGEVLPVRTGGEFLALVRRGEEVYALDDNCTHEECPLSDGILTDTELTCFCHGSVFDVRTGEALVGPALESVRVYPARIAGGSIEVELR